MWPVPRGGGLRAITSLAAALMLLAVAAHADPMPPPGPDSADLVVVLKSERLLYVYRNGLPIAHYPIALGGAPAGHKMRQGDQRTPEGAYTLDWRNPGSLFYKSIHIDYPNARDRRRAAGDQADPGGEIMIHGQPSYDDRPREGDWTDGCIAVSDQAMDELWRLIPQDTPIHIYP